MDRPRRYLVSVGGMRLRHWTGYLHIIWPTLKTRRAAKRAHGCVMVDTFKDGDTYFAASVWTDRAAMHDFAHSGIHADLMAIAPRHMAFFTNRLFETDTLPDRAALVDMWRQQIDPPQV